MILIFDIGKTNKKCFVFDEDYRIVFEKNTTLPEITDEDGDPCEDLFLLKNWVLESVREILADPRFQIRAVNCTTYGASFVHLDADGEPLTPLYNYLKPFPDDLKKQFFTKYGGEGKVALETASPVLGMLNSGLQLFWLKNARPEIFQKTKWSLHLPQFVASLLNGQFFSEITSLGCHTMLWDFQKNDYHEWVKSEGIAEKFPPIYPYPITNNQSTNQPISGLHDSSAALIPYLASFAEPFVLISTGTWCISLNPFNDEPLTDFELKNDCLCYLTFEGKPVKAARYFGGNEHEIGVKKLAAEFGVADDFYQKPLAAGAEIFEKYAIFIAQLVEKQVVSTRLAIGKSPVRRIFVDGGFSKNGIYMKFLAAAFPEMEVFAAEIAQATALGAAMVIHDFWNKKPMPKNLISLKKIRVPS